MDDITQQSFSGCYLLLLLSFLHKSQPPHLPPKLPLVAKWKVQKLRQRIKDALSAGQFGTCTVNTVDCQVPRADCSSVATSKVMSEGQLEQELSNEEGKEKDPATAETSDGGITNTVILFPSSVPSHTPTQFLHRCMLGVSQIAKFDWCGFVLNKLWLATERFMDDTTQQSFSGCYLLSLLSFLHKSQPPHLPPDAVPKLKH